MEEKDVNDKSTFQNPIDPEKVAENPGLLPYAHTVSSAVVKPEDKGKIKGRAMAAMVEQTDRHLTQLYDQMKVLAKQAEEVKKRVVFSQLIYDAEMGFEPLIGHHYYLYERKNGKHVLSMVQPKDWGRSIPFQAFVAEVKLLSDHTWEILNDSTS